jgi:hypothetical protein
METCAAQFLVGKYHRRVDQEFMPGIFMSWAQARLVSGSTNRINFKKNL